MLRLKLNHVSKRGPSCFSQWLMHENWAKLNVQPCHWVGYLLALLLTSQKFSLQQNTHNSHPYTPTLEKEYLFAMLHVISYYIKVCHNESIGILPFKSESNSSDAGDGIFWVWWSIPCLLMLWPLKLLEYQEAWYWLCRKDNMNCCSRRDFVYLDQANSKIRFKMWKYLL